MTNNTGVGPLYGLSFAYDSKGRRIQKIVTTNGVAFTTNTFLYDGWNLIAEVGTSGSLVRAYTWGTDLSGSQQGAGGVGGLLAIGYHGTAITNAFVAFDGNGNVTALVNAADGTLLANYDYGPFGEVIRATGPMAKANPFRFSTKYQDDESDLLYYGYRYYKASTGTWLSPDPIGERGGKNLYGFLRNEPILNHDHLGLYWGEPDTSGPDVLGPFSATGGAPHTSMLPRRHQSYLTFTANCPYGYIYVFDHVEYGNSVSNGLVAAGFTPQDIAQAIAEHGSLGGDASNLHPPQTPNCIGNAVSANAYMESRFTNPWFGISGGTPGDGAGMPGDGQSPDLNAAINAYVQGTTICYKCHKCGCFELPENQGPGGTWGTEGL